jgi:hypothetical protein
MSILASKSRCEARVPNEGMQLTIAASSIRCKRRLQLIPSVDRQESADVEIRVTSTTVAASSVAQPGSTLAPHDSGCAVAPTVASSV